MKCSNCFHSSVCGSSSQYNDASMCKQFRGRGDILSGPALKVVLEDYEKLQERNKRLDREVQSCELEIRDLERELKLLRIIKQTLEMQSGMKFDI